MCCFCTEVFGACCDPYTAICTDDVSVFECLSPLQFILDGQCEELEPPCGNPGCCCDDFGGGTRYTTEILCDGRFLPGVGEAPGFCDLDHDGDVDNDDKTMFLLAFGSYDGDPNWLADAGLGW